MHKQDRSNFLFGCRIKTENYSAADTVNKQWILIRSSSRLPLLSVDYRWGPLMGPGRAFDPTKFFIICCNVLGSPYGTASPVTLNPETKVSYGPEFPLATIRDDVRYEDHLWR